MNLPVDITTLPTLNACLNGTATVLLISAWVAIRRNRVRTHVACMMAALVVSLAFLASYVTYHVLRQQLYGRAHTSFTGTGAIRPVYFTILVSHLVLAMAIVPMVVWTLYRAARRRFDRHARLGRWTLPMWLYVSVTGVVVYFMLYHLYPSAGVISTASGRY